MKNKVYPAVGILVVGGILLLLNEYTEISIFNDYPLMWIIGGMFFGLGIGRWFNRQK